ncbi:MAG: hypothetical protein B0W54_17950 [Cellvibrio sp. 79]|nr:MAG: hypothetical protein B0W54_17950 [Cellvibrio sp. 79]
MKSIVRKLSLIACSGLLLINIGAANAETLEPGQLLTFVLSENKPGGEAIQKIYFDNAFPLAQAAGMKELTTFKIDQVVFGEGNPQGAGLYSWPHKAAAQRTRNNPKYLKKFKPLRPQIWNQLQSIDMKVKCPLDLTLDKTKSYSIALIWLNDRDAYNNYYRGTQALRDKLGAKTLFKLPGVRYEKLTEGEITPPDLVLLVQWNSAADLGYYSAAPEFQANHHYFEQGVKKMELYQLGFWN